MNPHEYTSYDATGLAELVRRREVTPRELLDVRGNRISMIFQEPMTSLNPVFPVGEQIGEVLRLHSGPAPVTAISALRLLAPGWKLVNCSDRPEVPCPPLSAPSSTAPTPTSGCASSPTPDAHPCADGSVS